jgi:hypothetical protein
MEGGLLQLLVAAAVLLLWLLGGSRKQERRGPPPRRRAVPRSQPTRRPSAPAPTPRREPTVEDLYRILTGEAPPATSEEAEAEWEREARPAEQVSEEARPVEQVFEAEARSLETLEAAGEGSHQRFREKYLSEPAAPAEPGPARREPLPHRPTDLRRAVIWREILGPPKGSQM